MSIHYQYDEPTIETSQVAKVLNISPQTVNRWANAGKLLCTKTPGGHRRFLVSDIETFVGHSIDVDPIGTYCIDCGARICGRQEVERCHTCAANYWYETADPAAVEAKRKRTRQGGLANFGKQYPKEPEPASDGGVIHWDKLGQRKRPNGQVIATVVVECACGHKRRIAVEHFERRESPTRCRSCASFETVPRGPDHSWWKGGFRRLKTEYILVNIHSYTEAEQDILRPMAYAPHNVVLLHRAVVALSLGRPLSTDEHVHHINFDKSDNRIENLTIMTHSEHMSLHLAERYKD